MGGIPDDSPEAEEHENVLKEVNFRFWKEAESLTMTFSLGSPVFAMRAEVRWKESGRTTVPSNF